VGWEEAGLTDGRVDGCAGGRSGRWVGVRPVVWLDQCLEETLREPTIGDDSSTPGGGRAGHLTKE